MTSHAGYRAPRLNLSFPHLRPRQSLSRKKAAPSPQCNVNEADHHRHLDQRTNNSSKGCTRIYAVDGNGYCDRQLEMVAGGGECKRGALAVAGAIHLLMAKEMANITTK